MLGIALALVSGYLGYLTVQGIGMLFLAVLLGWGYSMEPVKLAWRGWGEICDWLTPSWVLSCYPFMVIR